MRIRGCLNEFVWVCGLNIKGDTQCISEICHPSKVVLFFKTEGMFKKMIVFFYTRD